jgi:3-hydroxyacyl-CoA dehydrogenase/enoyl-CoA hydratase/3-hydroxybutyryl-CoA epimerase
LALLDEVGIGVAAHVTRHFGALHRERGVGESDALVRLHDAGFEGRKNRRGFYRYDGPRRGGRKRVNEAVYELLGGKGRRAPHRDSAGERCAMLMVNEAVHALEDDIVACPRDGDVGAVLGLGFPAVRGGPFRYLDALGAGAAIELLERLEQRHGPRFEPAALLRDMAGQGRAFYPG